MRILSGIQPSGTLHLGNYFGMMKPSIELQHRGEAFYFIADLHALTTVHDAGELCENIRDVAIDFLACGLDPRKACFFRQSQVPAVTELAWILSTVTPMGLLERCHSYKDKLGRGIPPSHGLFAYPVLMAADILIYDSDVVPVGKDQKQHIEVTRDLVVKFNETYGPTLKLPEPSIRDETAVVPGLDGQKMSKSYGNAINIFETEASMRKKVMSLKTDSTPVEAPKATEGSTILALYKLVASPDGYARMESEFREGGVGYGDFKKRLFTALWEYFAPMRRRREEILADPGYVEMVLREGRARANQVAEDVMSRVRSATGL
ncbi:MAG TPA: tryptophan--tRNA ligase [Terrimicrobiaceae bacterium]|nr:tryptophan--tRNA ligase [Terrimicrobiaceae bacterium]